MVSLPLPLLCLCLLLFSLGLANAQTVPPLQWIQLTNILTGDNPPALKDASIGYDPASSTLILFGGQQNGIPQSDTYLLNPTNLTWTKFSPAPNLPSEPPPARSAALSGCDFAASYRQAFIIIGGQGAGGKALADVWAFDFVSQFWAEMNLSPGGPSARWGSSGGIDIRVSPITASTSTLNNTFYLSGGYDGSQASALSDVWKLSVTGTLTSNNPTSLLGSWDQVGGISTLPKKVGQAGCVVGSTILTYGGCNTTLVTSDSCAQQDAYVISTDNDNSFAAMDCPSARIGASVIPNLNTASGTFATQALLFEGLFNTSLWNGGTDLNQGEVDVLTYGTGSWTRVLPAGDPEQSGTVTYPTPRQGAAVFSYTAGLFGSATSDYTDTIVYGGLDSSGNYLQDAWILRSYNGEATPSQPRWSGYGSGQLQTGVNANGAGVSMQFISTCAQAIVAPSASAIPLSTAPSSSMTPSPSSSASSMPASVPFHYETSITHKIASPVSVALLFPATLCYRFAFPNHGTALKHRTTLLYTFISLTTMSYILGVVGLIFSFTSMTTTSLSRRSPTTSSTVLKTAHGRLALAFFTMLYILLPLLAGITVCLRRSPSSYPTQEAELATDAIEKSSPPSHRRTQSSRPQSPASSECPVPRRRTQSSGPSSTFMHVSHEGALSSDDESTGSPIATSPRTFVVTNRPRHASTGLLNGRSVDLNQDIIRPRTPITLSDLDWLARRRSLNAVGELDYAMSVFANRANRTPTVGTMDHLVPTPISPVRVPKYGLPSMLELIFRLAFYVLLLAISVVILIILWTNGPTGAFATFFAWTSVFYLTIFFCAWNGHPTNSISTVLISRLRGKDHIILEAKSSPFPATPEPMSNTSPMEEIHYPFPSTVESRSPYYHQPLYRTAMSAGGHDSTNYHDDGPDDDDDENDEIRQRTMEEEMNRRDVSIVTVPRRKLWIANPESAS